MSENSKVADVRIKFNDGERTLAIHGIRPLQVMTVLDELGIKDWSELNSPSESMSVQTLRFTTKIVALALTFPKQETWTPKRIQECFADSDQIAKAFVECLKLSNLPKAPEPAKSGKVAQNSAYA